MFFIRWT